MLERKGFETRWAEALRRLGTADQSCRKELVLCLGKSWLATRDRLFLLLGAEDPEIAATRADSDKVFVLDKAMRLHSALRVMVANAEEKQICDMVTAL